MLLGGNNKAMDANYYQIKANMVVFFTQDLASQPWFSRLA